MLKEKTVLPKPRSEVVNPGITRLAKLTLGKRIFRTLLRWLSKFLVIIWTRAEVVGLNNIPQEGPALIVANHLGDADFVLGLAYAPLIVEPFAKIELYEIPVLGKVLDAYGVIWVHRGQPDRRALRVVMEAMTQKRIVAIAPEGRESLTGALEEGTGGAAYLAIKTEASILPVTFTGTENSRVFNNMKRFKRTEVTVTIGKPFRLERLDEIRPSIKLGTETIMHTLAEQLPIKYRGFYNLED
jgi:1-acyl-sn-glycerol-3-phosphate acyltransferase